MTPQEIKEAVSKYTGVSIQDMEGRCRQRQIIIARFMAMYFIREYVRPEYSLAGIGKEFGGRDHSSVIHALTSIENDIQTNKRMSETYESLRNLLLKQEQEQKIEHKAPKHTLKYVIRLLKSMTPTFEVNQKLHEHEAKLNQL